MTQPSDDLVERVARAICKAANSGSVGHWHNWIEEAQAALAAMPSLDGQAMREAAAKVAERDVDWSAFGKSSIEQWAGGPDDARDYRIGIATGRAIAAAIRALPLSPGEPR